MIEKENNLPINWILTKVDDLADKIHYGYTASSTDLDTGYKLLRITDIQNYTVEWEKVPYCKIDQEEAKKYLLNDGHLVFARTGATVGKSFLIKGNIPKSVFASYLIRIILNDELNKSYVYYFFQSPIYWQKIGISAIGIGQPNVNATILSKLEVPLSPFPEQNRIVAKIEELFSQLDAGIAELKKAQAQLKIYRQSVLKYAFEGKLTEEWRKENLDKLEPASEFIRRIKAEKEKQYKETYEKAEKEGKKKPQKPKELSPIDKSELGKLPEGWEWIRLDNISNKITDGEHIRPNTVEEGIPFLSAKDIRDNGVRFENSLFVSIEDAKKFRKRCDPEMGDILVVSRGATVGRSCIVNTGKDFCLLGSVILIKLDEKLYSGYFNYLLKSPITQKILIELSGSTAQQAIYIRDIKNIIIPICSIEEQIQIIQEIESRLSITDHLEQSIEQSLQKAEALRQSILKQAFEGKLVQQDPNDEPAEKLLERIKAEKENFKNNFKEKRIKKTRLKKQARKSS